MKARAVFFMVCFAAFLCAPLRASHGADAAAGTGSGAADWPALEDARAQAEGGDAAGDITLVATGDVYLGGRVASYLERFGPDYPYMHTAGLLGNADIVVSNLESPLTRRDEPFLEKDFLLKADPSLAAGSLLSAGVDVVTLANNHMMDFGLSGLRDTVAALDESGILHAGAGEDIAEAREPAVFRTGGVSIAVLAYSNTFPRAFYATDGSAGTAHGLAARVKADVARAAALADIVVVSFHWGAEKETQPKDYQVSLAHLAVDSGASLVIGHHPHTVQPVESYGGGVIFYSLGNFVFGSYGSDAAEGALAEVVFSRRGASYGVASARIIALDVANQRVHFRPVPLEGEPARLALAEVESRSRGFGTVFGKAPFDGSFSLSRGTGAGTGPVVATGASR